MMPRYAARRDTTEKGIVDGLDAIGWDCVRLSSGELPDLLCRHRATGRLELLEVESGHYKRRRSPEQREMLAKWQVPIVVDFESAVRALGAKIS
jgi:hypothetical protein